MKNNVLRGYPKLKLKKLAKPMQGVLGGLLRHPMKCIGAVEIAVFFDW